MPVIVYRNQLNANIKNFSRFLKIFNEKYSDKIKYVYSPQKRDFINKLTNFKYIILCAHGSKEKIFHRLYNHSHIPDQILFDVHNIALLKNKVIIAFSCSSAHTLGEIAIENGCLAYLGFKRKLHFERKSGNTTDIFYLRIRQCYFDAFSNVLDIIATKSLTIGQIGLILKNELSKQAFATCSNYSSTYPQLYLKHNIEEIMSTIADVNSNIVVLGNNREQITI